MLDYPLLAALAAVVRTGSFEQAAQDLRLTPSAVSQRVKQLEDRMGTVLVVRAQPCTATPAGARLIRHVEDVGLLEHKLRADLTGIVPEDKPPVLRLAINADSLATWFIDVIAACDGVLFDLVLDDEDYSADWLRRGEVAAAVTAQPGPVQGCNSTRLGSQRYIATASPAYMQRWFPDGVTADTMAAAPALTFNRKDSLQTRWAQAALGSRITFPTHNLPSPQAFQQAALAGVGWGMNPESLVAGHIAEGRLVALLPDRPWDVALYWQSSRIVASSLGQLNQAVLQASKRWLIAGP